MTPIHGTIVFGVHVIGFHVDRYWLDQSFAANSPEKNELDIILRRKRGKHLKLKIRDGQITKEVGFG